MLVNVVDFMQRIRYFIGLGLLLALSDKYLGQEMIKWDEHRLLAVKIVLDIVEQAEDQVKRTIGFAAGCLEIVNQLDKFVGVDWLAVLMAVLGCGFAVLGSRELCLVHRTMEAGSYLDGETSTFGFDSVNPSTTLRRALPYISQCCIGSNRRCHSFCSVSCSNRPLTHLSICFIFLLVQLSNFSIEVFNISPILPDDVPHLLILLSQFLSILELHLGLILQVLNRFLSQSLVAAKVGVQLLLV